MKSEPQNVKAEEKPASFGLYFFLGVLGLAFVMIIWAVASSGR